MSERVVNSSPVLYKVSGAGRTRQWQGAVVEKDDGLFYSRKIFGQREGKQITEDSLGVPKNVGKANETSSYEQAFKEMQADEEKKRKSGYNEDCSQSEWLFKPQKLHTYLAKDGSGKRDKFNWANGAYVTRKYNGIAFLTNGEDQWTRGLELYSLPRFQLPHKLDYTLVGELYLPDGEASTTIAGALRGLKFDLINQAIYVIFDCYGGDNTTFEDRRNYLATLDLPYPYQLDLGEKVSTEEEALQMHKAFVSEGEEGTVLREPLGIYKPDYRSYQVQRIKDVDSDVVTITKVSVDTRGCAIFFVRLEKHNEVLEFEVTPTGSLEDRREIYNNRENYINKTVEIKYMSYGQNGIPLFANALLETIN
jgi:hypothetical protein